MLSDIYESFRYVMLSQKYSWLSFFTYRTQAAIWLIVSVLGIVYTYVTISVIYGTTAGVPGWSYYQLLLLAATASTATSISWYVSDSMNVINDMRDGEVDPYLARPFGQMTVLIADSGNVASVSSLAGSLALLVFSAMRLSMTPAGIAAYVLLLAAGSAAFVLFLIMMAVLSYKLIRSGGFMWRMMNMLEVSSRYPLNVYGPAGQLVFSLLIPIGLAYFYPVQALFGLLSPVAYAACLAAAIAVGAVSYKLFYVFMRSYTSGRG